MLSKLFCKHTWTNVQEVYTESSLEHLKNTNGQTPSTLKGDAMCLFERKHITTFTCDKCGKIKRFVEGV